MKKSEWSDNELVELLRQMPKIKDYRDPHDIYRNLPIKKRKMAPWIVPSIAAVAALFLFFLLVPKLMNSNQYSMDKQSEEKSTASHEIKSADNQTMMKKSAPAQEEQSDSGSSMIEPVKNLPAKSAIYDEDVGNGKVLTFWIPDAQVQFLVPISMIVKNAKDQSWVNIFKEKMKELKETEWGLTDYYPLNADINWDEKQNALIVDVPVDHQYGQGAANETSFTQVLKKDVASNSNINKIILTTNGKPGIEFGNYGTIDYLNVKVDKKHAYFFYYPNDGKQPLLTPSTNPYSDVNTALEAMRQDQPQLGLKSPLAQTIQIEDVSLTNNILYVSLKGDQKLEDSPLATRAFEALLLTAKEFGAEKVVVRNSTLKHLGPFDLLKENKVPLAPNNLNE